VWYGIRTLGGSLTLFLAAAGLAVLLATALSRRTRAEGLIGLSLLGAAVLPWGAFVNGHPFRIRYMVPLVAAEAVGVAAVVWGARRLRPAVLLLAVGAAAYGLRPSAVSSPMVVEAQWESPNIPVRKGVTDCLRREYDGEKIMASMGSLGHYMQETAQEGFDIH